MDLNAFSHIALAQKRQQELKEQAEMGFHPQPVHNILWRTGKALVTVTRKLVMLLF